MDEVRARLTQIPGVVGVSIGRKFRCGRLCENEVVYQVYVREKKGLENIPDGEVIPSFIAGAPTDVLDINYAKRARIPLEGNFGFDELNDRTRCRPIIGGIALHNSENYMSEFGTLGCIARISEGADEGAYVVLTCRHVLEREEIGDENRIDVLEDRVAQPKYVDCVCCTCNEIGSIYQFSDEFNVDVDGAIILIDPHIPFELEVKELGAVNGVADRIDPDVAYRVAVGDLVKKRGARTLVTFGRVKDLEYPGVADAKEILIEPVDQETLEPTTIFAEHGDSGAVVLNMNNQVVGLLRGGVVYDDGRTFGRANHIEFVIDELGIEIPQYNESAYIPQLHTKRRLQLQSDRDPINKFREGLLSASSDQALAQSLQLVQPELQKLFSSNRRVIVAWHRNEGPAFMARVLNHGEIPLSANGQRLEKLLVNITATLEAEGSPQLRALIRKNSLSIMQALIESRTIEDFLKRAKEVTYA